MFVDVYGVALAIVLGSALLGTAICVACGGPARWWAAPAVGLSSLIVLEGAAIKLPGRAVTADVVGLVVLVAAAAFLLRHRRAFRVPWGDLVIAVLALLGASIPFVASGRVGLQGVSLLNDTSNHLLWAEGLRSSAMARLWAVPSGYPLGPHSLVAALGSATRIQLDLVFTGLLVAVVPITALVAAGVLGERAPLWRRTVLGLLGSFAYLTAAYYGEGAFKETILAGLLLAFVVHLGQIRTRWAQTSAPIRWLQMLPALLLVAGAVYTYSYLGLAWFGASTGLWVAAEISIRPSLVRRWGSRRNFATAGRWAAGAALLAVLALLPIAGQIASFFQTFGITPAKIGTIPAPLANLAGPLSPYEAFGVWLNADFRYPGTNGFHSGEASAFALAVLAFGILWSLRRRELLMPAAVGACALIWWLSQRTQSPYIAAKALVIASPLVMVVGLRALLTPRRGGLATRLLQLTIAAGFCALAGYSSYQSLRNAPVQAPEATRELESFAHTIRESGVLFLGDDDYAPWQLRPSGVTELASIAPKLGGAVARVNKPVAVEGPPIDFDSVNPADLDHFRYVITSNSPYASQPYANFRLIGRRRLYELWERTGPTVPRQILEPPAAPGAILDCHTRLGKAISARRGEASIMPTPVTTPGPGLPAGASASSSIALPRGRWEISIQYISSFNVEVSAGGRRWTMPAYLGRRGPFFGVGEITATSSTVPVSVTFEPQRPSFLTSSFDSLYAAITTIAATQVPDRRQLVPLRQACGKYIDWYRLS
jgi:hypothetical protein